MEVSVFCGSSKPSCDGVLVGLGFGGDGQSRRCPTVVEKGSRDLVVISVLLGPFLLVEKDSCHLYSCTAYLYAVVYLYASLILNTGLLE